MYLMRHFRNIKPTLAELAMLQGRWREHSRSQGLLCHLLMNEGGGLTNYDISGNQNNGVLTNSPVWEPGKFGHAMRTNGSSNYVLINSQVYLMTGGTVSFWFNKQGEGAAENAIVGGYGGSGDQRSPGLEARDTLRWQFGSLFGQHTGFTITNGVWYHVAMTWNSSWNVLVYANGNQAASNTSSDPGDFFNAIHIGHYANFGTNFFNGRVEEFRIYNYPLSPTSIQSIYFDPFLEFRWATEQQIRSYSIPAQLGIAAANYYYRQVG